VAAAGHLGWQTPQIVHTEPKTALRLFKSNRDAGLLLTAALLAQQFPR
jgi:4-hydroxybenzoate polyprenyltransferase